MGVNDDEITTADDLYGVEPDAFVAARNELVRRLRTAGQREDAAVVAQLRRPSATAWALNQVARHEPDLLERAFASAVRLREATDAAVAGDATSLRSAAAEERAASEAAIDAAAARLGARAQAARVQLAATLRAAVLDAEVGDLLRRGVLAADHEAPGFGFGASSDLLDADAARPARPAARPRPRPSRPDPAEEEQRRRAEMQAREQRQERAARDAELKRLEQRAARLVQAAERAAAAAEQARADADAATRDVAVARQALRDT